MDKQQAERLKEKVEQQIQSAVDTRPVIPHIKVNDIYDNYQKREKYSEKFDDDDPRQGFVETEQQYRVLYSKIPNTNTTYTILDMNGDRERGTQQMSLLKYDKKEYTGPGVGEVRENDHFAKLVPPVDADELIQKIEDSDITWKDYIKLLADDTGQKDDRLIQLGLAAKIPLPNDENREFWQSVNNHALSVLETGTGKSTLYSRLQGAQPSSDWSEAGLIGSVDFNTNSDRKTTVGALQGDGMYAFDEFPEVNKDQTSIFKRILNYTESGEAKRDIVQQVVVHGTKTLIFFGNPPLKEISERDFKRILEKLAGDGDLKRVGRRIGHIYYGEDFKTVDATDKNASQVRFLRLTVNEIINQSYTNIKILLQMAKPWLQKRDEQYGEELQKYVGYADEDVRNFISGHTRATSRIKCAALKYAIAVNLDKVYNTTDPEGLFEGTILPRAKRQYRAFKDYNQKSFSFLLEKEKDMVIRDFEKLRSPDDINRKYDVSKEKLEEWFDSWREDIDPEELHDQGISAERIAEFLEKDEEEMQQKLGV